MKNEMEIRMNQDTSSKNKSYNISRFLVPFFLEHSGKKEESNLFSADSWDVISKPTVYLTKYIQEIYRQKPDSICHIYRLKNEKRKDAGLPEADMQLFVKSRILEALPEEKFSFRLTDINAFYYATGIGFLVLTVEHDAQEEFVQIVNKCFAVSNIFTNEHDSTDKVSKLDFYYEKEGEVICFSLKNSIFTLLKTTQLKEKIELFPTNSRRKMNVYHRVYRKIHNDDDQKLKIFLSKGLHSTFIEKTVQNPVDEGRFSYATTDYTSWDVCSNGVTFLVYEQKENENFLKKQYSRNIDFDYFLIYLFALHERENLLRYNYQVVKNWTNPKALIQMKTELMRFNVWSGYNTVSIEMAYQDFYTYLYQALEIEKLEKDVAEIIEKVNEYVAGEKDRKLNAILTALGLLAVFSVFADGIGLVDRLYDSAPIYPGHLIIVGFICIVLGISVIFFLRKRK